MLVPLSALQIKTTQPALLAPARIPGRTHFFSTDFPPRKSLQNLSSKAHFSKKLPRIWCKCHLTLLASAYLPQKTRRKNTKKRPKIDLFRLFSVFFRPFLASFLPLFSLQFQRRFRPKIRGQREDHQSSRPNANPPPCPRCGSGANRPRFLRTSIACQEGLRQTLLQVPYLSATHSQPKFADNLPRIA